MKKKLLAIVTALMAVTCSGCGNSATSENQSTYNEANIGSANTNNSNYNNGNDIENVNNSDGNRQNSEPTQYPGSITVNYIGNIAVNKYSIRVELDGKDIGMIENGEIKKFDFRFSEGTHKLVIYENSDSSNSASETFTVSSSAPVTNFHFDVKATWSGLEFKSFNQANEEDVQLRTEIYISYKENIAINKYDIEVYLDDNKLGLVSQGDSKTFTVNLIEGNHTLKLVECGDTSNSDSIKFSVKSENYRFSFSCKAKWGGIKVEGGDKLPIQ